MVPGLRKKGGASTDCTFWSSASNRWCWTLHIDTAKHLAHGFEEQIPRLAQLRKQPSKLLQESIQLPLKSSCMLIMKMIRTKYKLARTQVLGYMSSDSMSCMHRIPGIDLPVLAQSVLRLITAPSPVIFERLRGQGSRAGAKRSTKGSTTVG
jgi:hypothetical protein